MCFCLKSIHNKTSNYLHSLESQQETYHPELVDISPFLLENQSELLRYVRIGVCSSNTKKSYPRSTQLHAGHSLLNVPSALTNYTRGFEVVSCSRVGHKNIFRGRTRLLGDPPSASTTCCLQRLPAGPRPASIPHLNRGTRQKNKSSQQASSQNTPQPPSNDRRTRTPTGKAMSHSMWHSLLSRWNS